MGFCSVAGFGRDEAESRQTPFQESADALVSGCGLQLIFYGHLPHLASRGRMKTDDNDVDFQKRCQAFPADLLKALENRASVDHAAAISSLAVYAGFARTHAADLREKDLALAVQRALAPDTARIQHALRAGLPAETRETRLMAGLALLSLDESDAAASEALRASSESADVGLPAQTAEMIGLAHLTTPQATQCLGRLLKHRDPRVRESAAGAAITLGPAARDLAPDLIAYLDTGENARGSYSHQGLLAPPQTGNLALMALEALQGNAKPAVPALVARFENSNDEDRIAILACLAKAGRKDATCLAAARRCLQGDSQKLKLAAACAVLHLAERDPSATEIVKAALAAEGIRKLAIETCQRFGPPSSDVAAVLVPLLDDQAEDVRISAMYALGAIGPHADKAVPAIEKLLAKEEDARTHTFLSTRAAARALASIRTERAVAALLRVAGTKVGGARYAILDLPKLGDVLPPSALDVLVHATEPADPRRAVAVVALSNLGERARPVRSALERLHEDPEIGWIVDTALRRIPASAP
jgi:HEAT repeat protein